MSTTSVQKEQDVCSLLQVITEYYLVFSIYYSSWSQQHKNIKIIKKTHKRLITFNLRLIFLGASQ